MNLAVLLAEAVRGALVLGVALIAVRLLGGAPAAVRRFLLVAALGAVLALPALSPLVTRWQFQPPGLSIVTAPIAEPLSEASAPAAVAGRRANAPRPAVAPALPLQTWLFMLWIAGAVVVAGRWMHGAWRARGLVRRSRPIDPRSWPHEVIERAERHAGARAALKTSDEVDAPAVTGLFRPAIVLPPDADAWTTARKRLVLVHELSHVARRDCLAQALAELCCALHWFDPLAWLAARRLRLERELSADDAVIASGARASSYAEELLGIAVAVRDRAPPSGALGMAGPSELCARVEAILEPSRARRPVSRATGALLLGGVGAASLAIACASPDTGTAPSPTAKGREPAAAVPAAVDRSSVDAPLQRIADEELDRLAAEWHPVRAVVLALDASNGEVLANAGLDAGARADVAARAAFLPGSTFKAVTVAAALEEGVVAPNQRFDCSRRQYGTRSIADANRYGTLDVTQIMAVSSNVGVSRIYDALGSARMTSWLAKLGFGKAMQLSGGRAEPGRLPASLDGWDGAMVGLGHGLSATPLQLAAAYVAFASGGVYFEPSDVHRAAPEGKRVLSARTAQTLLDMLEAVVGGERATGKAARIDGVRVAGKTGTAEQPGGAMYASFVGIVPADAPKYVVLVGAEVSRDDARGGTVAAPVFARAASRMLAR